MQEKEEADLKAREEAERKQHELEEKLKREEEERSARKRRIEEIMARTRKGKDGGAGGATTPTSSTPKKVRVRSAPLRSAPLCSALLCVSLFVQIYCLQGWVQDRALGWELASSYYVAFSTSQHNRQPWLYRNAENE